MRFIIQQSHFIKKCQKSVKAFFDTLTITTTCTIIHWAAPLSTLIRPTWDFPGCSHMVRARSLLGVLPTRRQTWSARLKKGMLSMSSDNYFWVRTLQRYRKRTKLIFWLRDRLLALNQSETVFSSEFTTIDREESDLWDNKTCMASAKRIKCRRGN